MIRAMMTVGIEGTKDVSMVRKEKKKTVTVDMARMDTKGS
jgi:hypothetical protein